MMSCVVSCCVVLLCCTVLYVVMCCYVLLCVVLCCAVVYDLLCCAGTFEVVLVVLWRAGFSCVVMCRGLLSCDMWCARGVIVVYSWA